MIKRIKKFIRGGDAATVADARWLVATEKQPCSCQALRRVGAAERFLSLYRRHSGARSGKTGFKDIPTLDWHCLPYEEKLRIRLARLDAFKESLK